MIIVTSELSHKSGQLKLKVTDHYYFINLSSVNKMSDFLGHLKSIVADPINPLILKKTLYIYRFKSHLLL
jgi:hypothetical protein